MAHINDLVKKLMIPLSAIGVMGTQEIAAQSDIFDPAPQLQQAAPDYMYDFFLGGTTAPTCKYNYLDNENSLDLGCYGINGLYRVAWNNILLEADVNLRFWRSDGETLVDEASFYGEMILETPVNIYARVDMTKRDKKISSPKELVVGESIMLSGGTHVNTGMNERTVAAAYGGITMKKIREALQSSPDFGFFVGSKGSLEMGLGEDIFSANAHVFYSNTFGDYDFDAWLALALDFASSNNFGNIGAFVGLSYEHETDEMIRGHSYSIDNYAIRLGFHAGGFVSETITGPFGPLR